MSQNRDPGSAQGNRVVPILVAALLATGAPSPAQASGGSAELFLLMTGLMLVPDVGAEHVSGGPGPRTGLLLSWPLQLPSNGFQEDRLETSPHRLAVWPEMTLRAGAEFRGRAGYRYAGRHVVAGLGTSYCETLGAALVPELGFAYHPFPKGDFNLFLVARADVPFSTGLGGRWAASLSAGYSFL